MKKTTATRKYKMTDARLSQFANKAMRHITRDLAELSTHGVTANDALVIDNLKQMFDNFPTDNELKGAWMNAVNIKNEAAQAVKKHLRRIKNRAYLHFKGEGYYHCYGFERLNGCSDNKLRRVAKSVWRMATLHLSLLANEGLTPTDLADLLATIEDFETKLDAMAAAEEDRSLSVYQRSENGNKLWAAVQRIQKIGRSVFEDEDEARANDYLGR